jgi:SAM-dependent methyltransferase
LVSSLKDVIERLINEARQASSHTAKFTVLTKLLRELFGIELVDLIPGIEKKVGSRIYGFRGRTDLLFCSVIFEVKVNLERELEDAKKELKKYFQALHEIEPERRHIGIATDVINFKAYMPVVKDGQVVDISEISSMNLSTTPIDEAILWLDSFIFHESKIRPTADDLKFRFGPGSPTYSVAVDILSSLWEEVKNEPNIELKLDLWTKNMEIVYGSSPKEKAFIDQTYLVTIVKLIVYYRLSGDNMVRADRIKKALTGEYFQSYGIMNLIEEDFFTWIFHPNIIDRALSLACDLAKELLRYDMSQIDEDLFKEIYQEIVKRSERHRIGEYYTPEWLVELTLKEALDIWFERNKDKDAPRILDPACGSGTFLCNAVRMIKDILEKKGKKPAEILDFILNNIIGIDINPLAVIIARANYLIALGELLRIGRSVVIPVYVSDSIRIPDVKNVLAHSAEEGTIQVYKITSNQYDIQIPVQVAEHRFRLGRVLSGLREALSVYRERGNKDEAKALFNRNTSDILSQAELEILNGTLSTLFKLVDEQRDEIWTYILNNIYAPIALKETKFDILASNPPWIAMRYIENKSYQDWVKTEVLNYGLLTSDQVELFTHMEIATLFFNKSAELYLHENGLIAFVMPRSVLTGAFHHINFKQFRKPEMRLIKILDFEDVSPLFNVPSCVLLAVLGEKTEYPVPATRYKGQLEKKNCKLSEAKYRLKAEDYMYEPPTIGQVIRYSYYHDKIKQGATIVPRNLWFIDFKPHPTLGIDVTKPAVKTSEEAIKAAKDRWKSIVLEGNVESDFIYATILGGDLIPFGFTKLRPVVMPVKPSAEHYRIFDVEELRNMGYVGMTEWLERAQRAWQEHATERSREDIPRVVSWINYRNKLAEQNPSKRYVLLYNTSGTNLVSCVVDRKALPDFEILKAKITPKGFIAESKTYFYETDDEAEAHYLCAVLNSDVVNERIKPLQTRGLYGERDIHRRPFILPIPRFYAENQAHLRLAELSRICHEKIAVAKTMFTGKSAAGLRKQAKETIEVELKEINELVSSILAENSDNK